MPLPPRATPAATSPSRPATNPASSPTAGWCRCRSPPAAADADYEVDGDTGTGDSEQLSFGDTVLLSDNFTANNASTGGSGAGDDGRVYQYLGKGPDTIDLDDEDFTDLDLWKELTPTRLTPDGNNLTASNSVAVGGTAVLNDVRGDVEGYIRDAEVTATGANVQLSADNAGTIRAEADSTAESSGGSAFGEGTSLAVNGTVATNVVQGSARAFIEDAGVTTVNAGNVILEAANSGRIEAEILQATTTGDTGVGVILAFNSVGWEARNILFNALDALLGTPIGSENPALAEVGGFDLAFVVVYLLPLFVIAFGHDMLSGERERGTLQLLLSQPVSRSRVLLAKAAALAVMPVGLFTATAVGAFLLSGGSAEEPLRLALFLAVVVAYGLFWVGLALAVGARGEGSATNAAVLASAWLALVLVVPGLLHAWVQERHPMPSRLELVRVSRDAAREANRAGAEARGRCYRDHPELSEEGGGAKVDDYTRGKLAMKAQVEAAVAPVRARFTRQLEAQQELVSLLRFLSPAVLAQEAMTDLADTGLPAYRDFARQAEDFHGRWLEWFHPRVFEKTLLTREDYEAMPRYDGGWEAAELPAGRIGGALAALVLVALALLAAGLAALPTYPVRGT